MPKPKSTTSRTFVCHGRLHRNTNAPAVLADRRVSAGILFDATLDQLDTTTPAMPSAATKLKDSPPSLPTSWASNADL